MRSITITTQESFAPLTSPRAMEIMATLYKRDKMMFTDISTVVGGSLRTITVRITELGNAGYINDVKAKSFPFRRMISLTKLGRDIASHVVAIEELRGEVSEPDVVREE